VELVLGPVVEQRRFGFQERDVAVVGDDKTEETQGGIRGCDCHGLILNAFLE
jgi:hypothetical protein